MNQSSQKAELEEFVGRLVSAVSNASLYSPEHVQVKRLIASAFSSMHDALGTSGEISLMIVDDELIYGGSPVGNNMYLNRFAKLLKNRGIGSIRIIAGVKPEEVLLLVTTLSLQQDRRSEVRSSENIRLGRVEVRVSSGEGEGTAGEGEGGLPAIKLTLSDLSVNEQAKLMEIYEGVKTHKKLNVSGIYDVVSNFIETFKQEADPLIALSPLRSVDEYTFTHSTNVCILNLSQAMAMGIEGQLLHDIGISAMLHDIGKLFIPEEILSKKAQLSDSEWDLMKQHPIKGAQHLLDTPGVPRLAVAVAFEHHMRFNFEGYPKVPKGWKQNLCSQMTAVSDFFDAMRSKRSYRGALEAKRIASIMHTRAGSDLHPLLTRFFFQQLDNMTNQEQQLP